MKTLAKTAINALVAVGLAGTAVAPALAQQYDRTTLNVTYSDLDLGTAKGQKILDQRVEKAVRSACRVTNQTTGTRMMSQEAQACLAKARSDAKKQVAAALANEQQRGG
jgi:UrcA family protein